MCSCTYTAWEVCEFIIYFVFRHERYIRLFSPVSSNWVTRAMVWFTGKYAEYFDPPKLIAEAQGREGII